MTKEGKPLSYYNQEEIENMSARNAAIKQLVEKMI
jgi:hypothetical protein